MMGQLPAQRVRPNAPFIVTGIDFAGHFIVKKEHMYLDAGTNQSLCLYICLPI